MSGKALEQKKFVLKDELIVRESCGSKTTVKNFIQLEGSAKKIN